MQFWSFVVVNEHGQVIDFGTYYHRQCCIDTAFANEPSKGCVLTIIRHDDDGNATIEPAHVV